MTGGNPFFVTEVLDTGGGVPATVRDAVARRAARLPADARQVLDAAGVLGARFDPDLLLEMGFGIEWLAACVEGGLLRSSGEALAFRHELVREAIYGTLSPTRRRMLHRAALDDRAVLGRNLSMLAMSFVRLGDNAAADAASREAIEVLEPHGVKHDLAEAHWHHAHLRMLDRDGEEAVRWGLRAIELASALGAYDVAARAHMTVGTALLLQEDPAGREHLDRSIALSRRHGLHVTVVQACSNLGSGSGELHRFDVAAEAQCAWGRPGVDEPA